MILRKLFPGIAALGMLLLSACINVQYVGKHYSPTTSVPIYTKKSQIPVKNYTVMGKAVASAPYQKFSAKKVRAKIQARAEAVGANAVLVTQYEVVPDGMEREDQFLNETPTNIGAVDDDSADGWKELEGNFDYDYSGDLPQGEVETFKRVYRCLFLHYNKSGKKP